MSEKMEWDAVSRKFTKNWTPDRAALVRGDNFF